ncbi:MAG: citrate lyase holo-[acyl-carrier protein] synthase [Eubacteriales bacterium]|nr:citrate lyase holo-[acyl-carrier protein] synthase [Eubacteriales bacterium]
MINNNLIKILKEKEERVNMRTLFLSKYKSPIIQITMNIPGENKNSFLISFCFNYFIKHFDKKFCKLIKEKKCELKITKFFVCTNKNLNEIKKELIHIEEKNDFGRLLDIDLFDEKGKKISRGYNRKCLLCDKEAFVCAKNKAHSYNELQKKVNAILLNEAKNIISKEMYNALLKELYTTPKLGCVSKTSNGSHKDLNIDILKKSAKVISSIIPKKIFESDTSSFSTKYKLIYSNNKYFINKEYFLFLQKVGLEAEYEMYKKTKNINTHKGAIYIFCILIGSLFFLFNLKIDDEYAFYNKNKQEILLNILCNISKYIATPVFDFDKEIGVKKENLLGFPHIKIAFDVLSKCNIIFDEAIIKEKMTNEKVYIENKKYKKELENLKQIIAYLHITKSLYDTTTIHRGGKSGLAYVQNEVKKIIQKYELFHKQNNYNITFDIEKYENLIKDINILNDKMIEKNLTTGGGCDVLCIGMLCTVT